MLDVRRIIKPRDSFGLYFSNIIIRLINDMNYISNIGVEVVTLVEIMKKEN